MTDERAQPFIRYTRGAIAFHWTIAALVVTNVVLAFGAELFGWRGVFPVHKAFGILVLVLTLGRIGWRWTHRPPPLPASVRAWERRAGHATHYMLYALTLALPITGWWFSSSAEQRRPLSFLGLFDIPYLPVARDPGATALFHDGHVLLGWLATAVVLLHVAAALRHQFVKRDATLARIVPGMAPPTR